jgi:phosphoribosyl-ATP pyrophosphohydrolase/phosphoribosyl-AMP cyclohydrolase
VVIEAKDDNDDLFLSESADLLFHYLILLQAKGFKINDVVNVLKVVRNKYLFFVTYSI